ncbi:V-type ATP synthase subunit D [Oscillospiraceae bacterium MB08-C2-2]|nr:V-type ATP synthase subunit D [Oscillospiraceae bacterium MB08-C2-2]
MDTSNIFPTKGNLLSTKKSLSLARMGYELMDRKRNILIREMMGLIDKANSLRESIDDIFQKAYQSLQRANITLGQSDSLAETVPIEEGLSITYRSVMGVELPAIHLKCADQPQMWYDFGSSNAAFDQAFVSFHEVKRLCATLAEIENCVYRLAVAIKKTQSRANALENIIIPRLEFTAKFISDALEEKDREEFSRLKVIKRVKNKKD